MSNLILTQSRLRELLDYNPETGIFTRKSNTYRTDLVGRPAGGPNPKGYHRIGVDLKRYLTHRLAWFYVHGVWPAGEVDHINRDHTDNRIANLRDVTPSENQHNKQSMSNNTSGLTGVSWDAFNSKWTAAISAKRKHYFLGRFDSAVCASAAYQAAKLIHHPTAPAR